MSKPPFSVRGASQKPQFVFNECILFCTGFLSSAPPRRQVKAVFTLIPTLIPTQRFSFFFCKHPHPTVKANWSVGQVELLDHLSSHCSPTPVQHSKHFTTLCLSCGTHWTCCTITTSALQTVSTATELMLTLPGCPSSPSVMSHRQVLLSSLTISSPVGWYAKLNIFYSSILKSIHSDNV